MPSKPKAKVNPVVGQPQTAPQAQDTCGRTFNEPTYTTSELMQALREQEERLRQPSLYDQVKNLTSRLSNYNNDITGCESHLEKLRDLAASTSRDLQAVTKQLQAELRNTQRGSVG